MNKWGRTAGLAALGALGAYWLYDRSRQGRAKTARGWMLKMQGEVLETLEDLRHLNQEAYHRAVDQAARRYQSLKRVNKRELHALVRDMKDSWEFVNRELRALRKEDGAASERKSGAA